MNRLVREKLGARFRAVAYLHDKGVWFDAFTCQYKINRSEFTDRHRKKINAFLPHIAKAIELSRPFALLRKRYQAVLAALDLFHVGVFVVESAGGVVVSNTEAQQILDLADGIAIDSSNRLRLTNSDENDKFRQAIRHAITTATNGGHHAETTMSVTRQSRSDSFLVEVCPFRDNRTEFDTDFRGAFVLVIDPTNSQWISTRRMTSLYQLTQAEAEICQLIAHGNRSDTIADVRNVSLETVRSQIKRVFEKTRTRHRPDLVRLAMTVNPPINYPDR